MTLDIVNVANKDLFGEDIYMNVVYVWLVENWACVAR